MFFDSRGESFKQIMKYWAPEFVSYLVLITLPILFDSYIIGKLHSTSTYGTLGAVNNFIHFLIKLAESVMVATIALVGRYNGSGENKKVGETLGNAFWTTIFLGAIPFLFLFFFSTKILIWLEVTKHMAVIGAPFIKQRSFSILLLFMNLSLFGFMRGIKNTKTPMYINIAGISLFMIFDYTLVLGKFGFTSMRLNGSAIATLIQYSFMLILSIWYILNNKEYKKYFPVTFFYIFNFRRALKVLKLSVPILIDKASLSYAYIHLSRIINPMGKYVIASFSAVKDLERLALSPAIGFASVITFLVANRLGSGDIIGARANIRKILVIAGIMVGVLLLIVCISPSTFVEFFDPRKKFTGFVNEVFPFISILVIFDFIQVILAGALRGAGDVKTVMIVRFLTCFGFFIPFSTWLSKMHIENEVTKFILLYGSFYLNTGIIGLLFIIRLKNKRWSSTKI